MKYEPCLIGVAIENSFEAYNTDITPERSPIDNILWCISYFMGC